MNENTDQEWNHQQLMTEFRFQPPGRRVRMNSEVRWVKQLVTVISSPYIYSDLQVKKEEGKEVMREDMLDDVVERYLTETGTFWLLDMPAVSVSVDAAEAESVK